MLVAMGLGARWMEETWYGREILKLKKRRGRERQDEKRREEKTI